MTQLLVGTKKGLFVLEGEPGRPFEVTSRAFAGEPVEFAMRDARTGRTSRASPRRSTGRRSSTRTISRPSGSRPTGVELPEDAEKPLERLWTIVPGEDDGHLYAGGAPGRALREPRRRRDAGSSTRRSGSSRRGPSGAPARAACACTRSRPGPATRRASRSRSRRSASGSRTTAARRGATGTRASYPRYMPEEAREDTIDALRPQHAPRAEAARAALHAVPRRRLPLRRRRRELDVDRRRPAVRLRLPDGGRPGRSGQRVRHPARRGPGPHDARGARPRLRDARRGRDAGSSAATASRRTTRTSRSSARRSAARARGRRWGSTSERRRATCSARATPARRGSRRRRTCRRCTRCAPT